MNNEPVAWRNLCVSNIGEDSEWIYNEIGQGEPLYTHPAKTLTDDEMELAYYECFDLKNKMPDNEKRRSYFKFARAILRKAQEG